MTLPTLPRPVTLAARPLPLLPVSVALTGFVRRLTRQHPSMLRRLGAYAEQRFLLDPTDLPFVLLLQPGGSAPKVTAHRRHRPPPYDSRITGALSAFLAMMHAGEDGDALFFSRELEIKGDTAAVLALRNAIDDAELDLTEELATLKLPFVGAMPASLRRMMAAAERLTGFALHRLDLPGERP